MSEKNPIDVLEAVIAQKKNRHERLLPAFHRLAWKQLRDDGKTPAQIERILGKVENPEPASSVPTTPGRRGLRLATGGHD
jgi:hypothetical protein